MNETNVLTLSFITDSGQRLSLTVPRANPGITQATVRNRMEGMINGGIILTTQGRPTSVEGAVLVNRATETII